MHVERLNDGVGGGDGVFLAYAERRLQVLYLRARDLQLASQIVHLFDERHVLLETFVQHFR